MSQVVIGNKTYEESDELRDLAVEVMKDEQSTLVMGGANIRFMKVYPDISKKTAGRCIKASRELKYFSDCDYIIEMSGNLWDNLNPTVRYILMYHELLHIWVDVDDEGNDVYKMRDHDVTEFREIIEKHGIDWMTTLQDSMTEVSGSDEKMEGIKL